MLRKGERMISFDKVVFKIPKIYSFFPPLQLFRKNRYMRTVYYRVSVGISKGGKVAYADSTCTRGVKGIKGSRECNDKFNFLSISLSNCMQQQLRWDRDATEL